MKAVLYDRYGGPEVLRFADVPEPEPGAGEVLIQVRAASVIPGDWKLRAGHLQSMFPVTFPKIPGRDGAGTVAAAGPGADYAKVGDAVCFVTEHTEAGSNCEFVARGRERIVAKPDGLSFAEAAALMHAGVCAWICLVETARVEAGMKVLVHGGAGAIGGMAVQIARHFGAEVAATCHSRNVSYVESLGAIRPIAYDLEDFGEVVREVDVVVDLIGGDVHHRSYPVLRKGGTMVWLIAAPFEDRSAAFGVRTVQAEIHDDRRVLEAVVALAADGAVKPQVSRRMALEDAAEAHRLLEAGENSRGRIVLEP